MIHETTEKSERKGKRPPADKARVPGVRAAAKALGVSPGHLWLTVAGYRTSYSLMRRYRAYLAEQKGDKA